MVLSTTPESNKSLTCRLSEIFSRLTGFLSSGQDAGNPLIFSVILAYRAATPWQVFLPHKLS